MSSLIIGLHGLGGSGRLLREHSGLDEIAAELGANAIFPDGVARQWPWYWPADSETWRVNCCWLRERMIDYDRVAIVGFSAGANYAIRHACDGIKPTCIVSYAGQAVAMDYASKKPSCPALFLGAENDSLVPFFDQISEISQIWPADKYSAHQLPPIDGRGQGPLAKRGHVWDRENANPVITDFLGRYLA